MEQLDTTCPAKPHGRDTAPGYPRLAQTAALLGSFGAFFVTCPFVLWDFGLFEQARSDAAFSRAVCNAMLVAALAVGVAAALRALSQHCCRLPTCWEAVWGRRWATQTCLGRCCSSSRRRFSSTYWRRRAWNTRR